MDINTNKIFQDCTDEIVWKRVKHHFHHKNTEELILLRGINDHCDPHSHNNRMFDQSRVTRWKQQILHITNSTRQGPQFARASEDWQLHTHVSTGTSRREAHLLLHHLSSNLSHQPNYCVLRMESLKRMRILCQNPSLPVQLAIPWHAS